MPCFHIKFDQLGITDAKQTASISIIEAEVTSPILTQPTLKVISFLCLFGSSDQIPCGGIDNRAGVLDVLNAPHRTYKRPITLEPQLDDTCRTIADHAIVKRQLKAIDTLVLRGLALLNNVKNNRGGFALLRAFLQMLLERGELLVRHWIGKGAAQRVCESFF